MSALIIAVLFTGVTTISNQSTQAQAYASTDQKAEQKVVTRHAKHKQYKDLDELEKKSDYVVKAKFTGERTIHNWTDSDSGEVVETASKTEVEIKKDFKGDLEKGEKVFVYEPGYFDDDIYVNVEGYELMEENEEYTLFLRKIDNDDTLMLVGMYQGKYKLDKDKNIDYKGENRENFEKLKKEVKEKYKDKN